MKGNDFSLKNNQDCGAKKKKKKEGPGCSKQIS